MRGAGSYWAERIQFTKDQYTEITKKQGHRTLFFCLFLGGVSSELVLHLDWYYGGDGFFFFTGFRVFGFHYFGDYNRLHVVHMYFYTLYTNCTDMSVHT